MELPSRPQLLSSGADNGGGESSRWLLLTILGEFVLPSGGSVWTQTLVQAMGLLGIRDKAARQAIARMHERNWLHRERVGRQTRWSLTKTAAETLESGADRIYSFGAQTRDWDRRWIILLASVPEGKRKQRYQMGLALSWAGFGSLGNGTWLSPWTEQESVAIGKLNELEIDATSFIAELGQLGSGQALAESAWDLPEIRARYGQFLADTAGVDATTTDGSQAAGELVALVHRWRNFPLLDPDLPAPLLPADWPGGEAAKRFIELRAALRGPANLWWRETEAAYQPRTATN